MDSQDHPPRNALSRDIWEMKYRYVSPDGLGGETSIEDSWRRVAHAVSAAESADDRVVWADSFYKILEGYRFLPAGRILAGAGTNRQVTLFNCFVMGRYPGFARRHFHPTQGSCADDAAGWRHRPRLFDAPAPWRSGQGRGCGCIWAFELHGCVGRDVQDDHVRWHEARGDDGNAALRPPGHRGVHPRSNSREGCAISICQCW